VPQPPLVVVRLVSIHAPTRGATLITGMDFDIAGFQSTRPRGARPLAGAATHALRSFNPRAHAGRDAVALAAANYKGVSIHAPTRGATGLGCLCADLVVFQSTRPRGARQYRCGDCRRRKQVSIHAPTRGATSLIACAANSAAVSIHAPTRGATTVPLVSVVPLLFQSTRPRGARPVPVTPITSPSVFQSTRPRGARQAAAYGTPVTGVFQSTRPRGARLPTM